MKDELYQFKITLNGSTPPIWRRVVVNSDMTFWEFHELIQQVMGWENCHFYSFQVEKRMVIMPEMDMASFGEDVVFSNEVSLHETVGQEGQTFVYTYDFGNDWQHDILLEQRLPVDKFAVYPVCTGGEQPCPPEECGGLCDYYMLLESGDLENPGAFDMETVNVRLRNRS